MCADPDKGCTLVVVCEKGAYAGSEPGEGSSDPDATMWLLPPGAEVTDEGGRLICVASSVVLPVEPTCESPRD